jgi:hypothetical protein
MAEKAEQGTAPGRGRSLVSRDTMPFQRPRQVNGVVQIVVG